MVHRIAVPALALVPALSLALAGAVAAQDLSAEFIGNDGAAVGTVSVTEGPNGLILQVAANEGALAPGWHGLHIHENADCSDHEAFQAAGGHLNPGDVEHGFLNPNGPHPSDLPNLFAHADGSAQAEFFVPAVTLSSGETALLEEGGAAMMIHAGPDDYMTDPSGDSGDRVACAVLE